MKDMLQSFRHCSPVYTISSSLVVVTLSLLVLCVPYVALRKLLGMGQRASILLSLGIAVPWMLMGQNGTKSTFESPRTVVLPTIIVTLYALFAFSLSTRYSWRGGSMTEIGTAMASSTGLV